MSRMVRIDSGITHNVAVPLTLKSLEFAIRRCPPQTMLKMIEAARMGCMTFDHEVKMKDGAVVTLRLTIEVEKVRFT